MNAHRFCAPDMRTAMRRARRSLGPDAVLLTSSHTAEGAEVVAAPPGASLEQPAATGGGSLATLRDELHGIHVSLREQVSALADAQYQRRHPLRARLMDALIDGGFDRALAGALISEIDPGCDERVAWEETLGAVASAVSLSEIDPMSPSGTVIAVGPPGVGKTTTLVKLAARAVRDHGPENVQLITLDQQRLGAREQFQRIGQLLEARVVHVKSVAGLAQHTQSSRALTLIDTGGRVCNDPELAELIQSLTAATGAQPFLVMSAALQRGVFARTARFADSKRVAGVILTHLDEAENLGESLSVIIRNRLSVAAVCDCPVQPAGIRRPDVLDLVDVALRDRYVVQSETVQPRVAAHA